MPRRTTSSRPRCAPRSTASAASRSETPFAFYAWLLGGDGGRARILRRLGHEANDALDEFLELALGYERKAPASLQGFMAWLRAADTEVKRDMEISRDEVRVMTVHGAKGLEAPVVFLVDTTTSPVGYAAAAADPSAARQCRADAPVSWSGPAGRPTIPPPSRRRAQAMLDETEDEYRRLLYVAMTRAADRLIVGGCMPGNMNTRPQALLVRPDRQGPRAIPDCSMQDDRDAGRQGETLFAASRMPLPPGTPATAEAAAPIALPAWLRDAGAARKRRRQSAAPVRPGRR